MKTKKIINRTIKIILAAIGSLILLWTIIWLMQVQTANSLGGLLIGTIFLAVGFYGLLIFIAILLIYLLIKFIIKMIKKLK